jgi:hypothetical protein
MSSLVSDRQWYIDRKAELTLRLGKAKTTRSFEQILKQITKHNVEIRKLGSVIRDYREWL